MQNGTLTIKLVGRIDSVNAGATEKELTETIAREGAGKVTLDCAGLEYISSAGLRVLLKLRKRLGGLKLIETSPEVYDVFEMTGFTELLDVQKCLREVPVEGLELLGSGANGSVYRLTRDEMVKAFRPGISLDVVESERIASRTAFTMGVPCAIPFDTVRCGEGYGTVYELLDAATLTERIRENPDDLERYAVKSAELLKSLHTLEVPAGVMHDAAAPYYEKLEVNADKFSEDEVARLRSLYDAIPPMNRFVHNDYHTRNIMESGGELTLIDLGESGAGNPLFDLLHSCLVFNLMGTGGGQKTSDDDMSFVGLTYGELKRFWNVMLASYCGSSERASRLTELLMPYARLTYLAASMAHPLLPVEYHPTYVNAVRSQVLSRADEMLASVDEMLSFIPE
jgi:uncharacterized protein (TIGR02172 family)